MPTRHLLRLVTPSRRLDDVTGRQLHGLACELLERALPELHEEQTKFFTVWPLQEASDGTGAVTWRLHWLRDDCDVEPLLVRHDGSVVRLGTVETVLRYADSTQDPFDKLASLPPAREVTIEFHTPTYFSRSGRRYPLPDPELIVRRLIARWNECQPDDGALRIGEAQARALGSSVELVEHELCSAVIVTGRNRGPVGFVGRVRLRLAPRKTAAGRPAKLLACLAGFANYCGVGAQTTHGCGAVTAWASRA